MKIFDRTFAVFFLIGYNVEFLQNVPSLFFYYMVYVPYNQSLTQAKMPALALEDGHFAFVTYS